MKNRYNPNKTCNHKELPQRKSIRLKGYDYSQAGLYFITICVQDRECLFGNIANGIMKWNDAGKMIMKWYYELENKFPDIKCGEHIVMPNHFHCIIHNIGNVGADLRVCPNNAQSLRIGQSPPISGEHVGSHLHRVVQWFKTMTTYEYIRNVNMNNWRRFDGKLWQRNYWEHIIRNEKSHQTISKYIVNNPVKWNADKLNPKLNY